MTNFKIFTTYKALHTFPPSNVKPCWINCYNIFNSSGNIDTIIHGYREPSLREMR